MKLQRFAGLALLGAAMATGTLADRPASRPPTTIGDYRVLAADFHVHSSWSNGALTPWGLVLEAERQALDVIAVTGHNQLFDSKVARWFGRRISGPTVLTGQEIQRADSHVIALGIEDVVDWRQDVASQIDVVHDQGGVAIAAHPGEDFWPGFDATALSRLDGAEICHPSIFAEDGEQAELEEFFSRATMAAIGSSDFHGVGRLGMCRTYVFTLDESPAAILDALRAHRTVVYGLEGRAYGDPALIDLASEYPELQRIATSGLWVGWLDWLSRICGFAGLLALLCVDTRSGRHQAIASG